MKNSVSMEMSAGVQSRAATAQAKLDESLTVLSEQAPAYARLGAGERAALLRACMPRLASVAREWVVAACKAKGLTMDTPPASDEWIGGPWITMRALRLFVRSLDDIHRYGKPRLPSGAIRAGWDDRTEVQVLPLTLSDRALFGGFSSYLRMQEGMTPQSTRDRQASLYQRKDPKPGVSLVLGAGNVASIPPTDALHKLLVDGQVCLIKLNPVNEYLGPFLEHVFHVFVERGYMRFAYGGAEVGSYLCTHRLVDDVHITGSDRTHDLIVWGPPGPERDRRQAADDPVLKKTITSELGCVTPLMIVPGEYSSSELLFIAGNVATQVVNNASFNCNAAKVLVTSESWPQRETFIGMVRDILEQTPPRLAYYPGAEDRYAKLTQSPGTIVKLGRGERGKLQWALIRGLDPSSDDLRFCTEPFCGILSEAALPEREPAAFLRAAAAFSNQKLWGTLSCSLIIQPRTEAIPEVRDALNRAVDELRYGVVAINHWPAVAFALISPPWGGHPSATLKNVQSGIGFVHNSPMIEGIEKAVLRGPLKVFPKPSWFVTNRRAHVIAEKMVGFEWAPGLLKMPGIVVNALRG